MQAVIYAGQKQNQLHCLPPLKADGGTGGEEGLGSTHSSRALCCPSGIVTHWCEAPKGVSLSSPAPFRAAPWAVCSMHHLFGISAFQGQEPISR